VNIAGAVEQTAARILRDVPGIVVQTTHQGGDAGAVGIRAGTVSVAVELKAQRITNAAAARHAVSDARALPVGAHLVVVAETITEDARDQLTRAGVGSWKATAPGHATRVA